MSAHVEREQWPVMLSSWDDPELRAIAEAHARTCPDCERERLAAAGLLNVLATLPPLPGPSADTLKRASGRIVMELRGPPPPIPWVPLAAGAAFALLVGLASHRALEPRPLLWAGGLLLVGLGLGTLRRAWGAALAVSVLAAWGLSAASGFELGHGLRCAGVELFAAALPVGALWMVARRGLDASPMDFARAALGGAIAGQAALVLTCASHAFGHLLVFHSLVVVAAMAMGALVGTLAKPAPV